MNATIVCDRDRKIQNASTLNRRAKLKHNRADAADRLRVLRSRGMRIVTIWSGASWAIMEPVGPKSWNWISTINSRIEGVFVAEHITPSMRRAADEVVPELCLNG